MEEELRGVIMSNLKNIEVELKFPLMNHEELAESLNTIAKKQEATSQKDTYYIPKHRNFLEKTPISEWLRIREEKDKITVNYKNWHDAPGGKTISCDEFETGIDNAEIMKNIFRVLDFKEIIIVEKTRNTWHYKDVLISIDMVEGLGNFIELEANGSFPDIQKAKDHLYRILNEINAKVGEQDHKGYPHLVLEKKNFGG
jgi:adenylate cyclase class 2